VATVDGTTGGSPLVGRAAERATVDAILADAKRGQGGSLVPTGGPQLTPVLELAFRRADSMSSPDGSAVTSTTLAFPTQRVCSTTVGAI
jgi:hypothetical protein